MDKISNQLFLNYTRPNGKPFKAIVNNTEKVIPTGAVHVFPEMLVPGASNAEQDMLTSLANSLFLEARSHNMSLAPYGRNDPVKVALAGTFIGVLMADALGDLSVIGKYSFANVYFGEALAKARDIQLVSTEEDFANLCKKFNMIVAKVNSLYIPITGFARRWYEHRRNIYKDDEGDRYSLYTYYLQNYYEYITDATDANAGRLVCRVRTHKAFATDGDEATGLDAKLDEIDRLVSNYLADDDFSNFCSEALNAGMPHMTIAPLKSVAHETEHGKVEQFVGPELKLVYNIDDVLGLENACFVWPTVPEYKKSFPRIFLDLCSWDIWEDITKGRLVCGRVFDKDNVLPAFAASANTIYQGCVSTDIAHRPIFTHGKITSLPGLTSLTRYIVATGSAYSTATAVPAGCKVITYSNGFPVTTNEENTAISVVPITCHGTEMLTGHMVVLKELQDSSDLAFIGTNRRMQIVFPTSANNYVSIFKTESLINLGFKARFVTYYLYSGAVSPAIADFDYVVSITDDALSTFFGANAWNDTMLITKMDETSNSSDQANSQ